MTNSPPPAVAPAPTTSPSTAPVPAPVPPPPAPKHHWKRNLIVGGVGLLVLGLLVWAFKPKPLSVEVASVTQGRFERAVQEYGKTRVRERYIISSPLTGRVDRVLLKQGDSVKQGDIVALLRPMVPAMLDERARDEQAAHVSAMAALLARTVANVGRATAAQQQAQIELTRSEALAQQGFVAPSQNETGRLNLRLRVQELESARQEENAARYELEMAKAARRQFAQTPPNGLQPSFAVKAPVNGNVLKVLQQSEASVLAGTALVELGDAAKLEVVVDILTEDATEVRSGAAVQLLNWGNAQVLTGQVRWVEPAAFTKVSALGVEEQRVNVIIDITAPPVQWRALGDGFKVDVRVLV